MKAWSLGAKLTAWSALMLAALLIPCGVGIGFYLENEQIESLDAQLANEAHTFFGELQRHPKIATHQGRRSMREILPLTTTERLAEVTDREGNIIYSTKKARDVDFTKYAAAHQNVRVGSENFRLGIFRR